MPRKPMRPYSHKLETESRLAFENAIPSNWVFRPIFPDYGIDGSVEIFDEKNEAAGLQFLLQLKASATWSKTRRLRIKRSTFDYLIEQPIPCIVVLYDASTQELKYQWLEGIPSYTIKVTDHYVSLPLETFELFKNVSAKIENELALLRQLTDGNYSSTLGLRVIFDENIEPDLRYLTAAELVVKESRGLLRFVTEGNRGLCICVRVGEKGTLFQLSLRYHVGGSMEDSQSIHEMVESLASGILYVLFVSQKYDLLNYFAQVLGSGVKSANNRRTIIFVSIALCHYGHAHTGFVLLADILQRNCSAVEVRAIRSGLSTMQAERIAISSACVWFTDIRNSISTSEDCAAEFDWLLADMHAQVDSSLSYQLYRKALRKQPEFRKMPDFWWELAQCQVQIKKFPSAKRSFLICHSLEQNIDCLCCAGNAALEAGELTAAEDLFLKAGQGRIRGINRLKLFAIRVIRRFIGSDKVKRMPERARELLLSYSEKQIPKHVCSEVLKLDPLNAIAWRNIGMQNMFDGEIRLGAEQVLVAASLARNEGRYWAESYFLMVFARKMRLAEQVLHAGCWTRGPAFVAEFKEVAEREMGIPLVPPEFLSELTDRAAFAREDAHDQADKRYSSWLQRINTRYSTSADAD